MIKNEDIILDHPVIFRKALSATNLIIILTTTYCKCKDLLYSLDQKHNKLH